MTQSARPSPRLGFAVVITGLVAVGVLMYLLVPWSWIPGGHLGPISAGDVFSQAQISAAKRFAGPQRVLGWSALAVSLLVTCAIGLTSVGRRLVARLPRRWWLATPLAVLIVLAAGQLATMPLAWAGHDRALDAGLTNQGLAGWLRDQGTGLAVAWVSTTLAMLVVLGIARLSPRRWPLWLAAAGVAMTFAGSFVYPVAVEPLFNDFHPMAQGQLRTGILALAQREGVHVDDVLVADASRRTTTLNAYVSGLGSTRRVVVYDNLINDAPRDEVLLVIAHELGHARDHDVLIGTSLAAAGMVVGVGLLSLLLGASPIRRRFDGVTAAEPAVVPLVLALSVVATLLVSPVQNSASRALEARADRTSLEVTHDPTAFIALHRRLALKSLADPTPPALSQWWFGSHPTVLQRIAMAETLRLPAAPNLSSRAPAVHAPVARAPSVQ